MSLLAEALNRIRAWLETNYPEIAEKLPPGLGLSEIQKILEILPFKLPNEVYELYQWSCGTDEETRCNNEFIFDPYDNFALCSLEQALNVALTFKDELDELTINYLGQPLFPIFQSELSYLCVIGNMEKQEFSPIILVDGDCMDISLQYTSLTSMMLTLAECFETGVLYEYEGLNNSKNISYRKDDFSIIYQKYNHDVPNLSITNLCQYLLLEQADINKLWDILEAFCNQVGQLKRHWKDLSFNEFSSKLTEPVIAATQHEDEDIRLIAISAINMFNCSDLQL